MTQKFFRSRGLLISLCGRYEGICVKTKDSYEQEYGRFSTCTHDVITASLSPAREDVFPGKTQHRWSVEQSI